MKEFKKILVPVDFTTEVNKVLFTYVKSLAQSLGSEIHLLHVQETIDLLG